jgi:hypothetical protein
VTQKEGKRPVAFLFGNAVWDAMFGGERSRNLGQSNFAQNDGMTSQGISQPLDPGAASFRAVAFDRDAGVQIMGSWENDPAARRDRL